MNIHIPTATRLLIDAASADLRQIVTASTAGSTTPEGARRMEAAAVSLALLAKDIRLHARQLQAAGRQSQTHRSVA